MGSGARPGRPLAAGFLATAGLLCLLLLVLGAAAERSSGVTGCDAFASPRGFKHADGSLDRPYRTPQRLLHSLNRGQTGCFLHGTYRFRQLVIKTPQITLHAYGSEHARLHGEIKIVPSGAGSVIEDLSLNGARGRNHMGPRINADGVVLRDNRITNHHTGICVSIARYFSHPAPRGVVIERNRIHGCGRLPATNHQHGIYVTQARDTIIRDNWIYGNADRGIQLYPAAQDSTITGNVIVGNGQGVVFSGAGRHTSNGNVVSGNVIVKSRIRWNASSGPDGPRARGNHLRGNCVFASRHNRRYRAKGGVESPSRNFRAADNLVARPRFVRAKRGDFRLREDSRCRSVYTGTMSG